MAPDQLDPSAGPGAVLAADGAGMGPPGALEALARLGRPDGEPVFAAPWQAEAFAIVVRLHAAGVFSWSDWAGALGRALQEDLSLDGSGYYVAWVRALEGLLVDRGLLCGDEISSKTAAWARAYAETPHGRPVVLD